MRLGRAELEQISGALQGARGRGWVRANCPLCEGSTGKADQKMSLGLNTATGGFVCHKCGAKGYLPPDLLEATPYDGLAEPETEGEQKVEAADGYVPIFSEPGASAVTLEPYRRYVLGRGVSEEAAAEALVGASAAGRFAGRVIVPHVALDGSWAGWVGRHLYGGVPVYRYPRGMRRDRLWNERALAVETDEPVMLVEGVFDALPYWPDAAAFLGKPSVAHVEAVLASRRPVCVVLDGDAHEEGWAFAQKLRFMALERELGLAVSSLRLEPGIDPGKLGQDGCAGWLRACVRKTIELRAKT